MDRSIFQRIPVALTLSLLILITVAPVVAILSASFVGDQGFTLDNFKSMLDNPKLGKILLDTVIVVIVSAAIAVAMGILLAVAATKLNSRRRWLLRTIPYVPLTIAPLIGALGWVFLLAPTAGWLNIAARFLGMGDGTSGPVSIYGIPGVIWVTSVNVAPYVFGILGVALGRTSPELFEAYIVNGSSRELAVLRVIAGPMRPALLAATVLAIVESAVQFSIPLILKVDLLTTEIYRAAGTFFGGLGQAAVLALPLLAFGIALTFVEHRLLRGRTYGANQGKGISTRPWALGRLAESVLEVFAFGYLMVAVVLPLAGIVMVSLLPYWRPQFEMSDITLSNYEDAFASNRMTRALMGSLGLAAAATALTVGVSILITFLRVRRTIPRAYLYHVANIPLGIPAVVMGLAALLIFTQPSVLLYGTWAGIAIAYAVHYLPLAVRNIDPLVQQISPQLEEAVTMSGGGSFRRVLDVRLPLATPAITVAAFFVGIHALREFPISAFLSSPTTPVIAVYMVDTYENGVISQVAVVAMLLSAISFALVLVSAAVNARVGTMSKPNGAKRFRNQADRGIPGPPPPREKIATK